MPSYWPLFDLRLETPRTVLRPHRDDDFPGLLEAISRALGYRENGRSRQAPRGCPKVTVNFELTRDEWLSRRDTLPDVGILGLEQALPMFSPAAIADAT